MKKKKTFLGVALLVAVLMLGIGYAVVSNVGLNITGTATADTSDANFVVKFDKDTAITTAGTGTITGTITGDQAATLNITGLTAKNQTASATFTVKNASPDLTANLSVLTEEITETGDDTGYFAIDAEFDESSITAGNSTTVTVTVTMLKTPVDGTKTGTIKVQLQAAPVQP